MKAIRRYPDLFCFSLYIFCNKYVSAELQYLVGEYDVLVALFPFIANTFQI